MTTQHNAHTHEETGIQIVQAGFQDIEDILAFYTTMKVCLGTKDYFLKNKTVAAFEGMAKRGAIFCAQDQDGITQGVISIAPQRLPDSISLVPGTSPISLTAEWHEINSFVIAPDYAGHRLAQPMIRACENWAAARGRNNLFARVVDGKSLPDGEALPGNGRAKKAFKAAGYGETGTARRDNDPSVTVAIFTKKLDPRHHLTIAA